jgi:hypothetical protein
MSAFNTLISGNASQTTTLPSWYDAAQQNVVANANIGASQMPNLQNTVAGQAINNLSNSATNPFTQGQGYLNQISSGAANPWIQGPNGTVTPNTSTALGGLFQAQNQELQQLIPEYTAQPNATSIAGGQFGSLRNQTAADTAIANAQAQMLPQQMQAALQNQQTGVNAATGLGNIGAQGTATETTLGQAQQAAPLTSVADIAQILGTIKAPTTVTQNYTAPLTNQISALQQLGQQLGVGNLLKNLTGSTASKPMGNTNYNTGGPGNIGSVDSQTLPPGTTTPTSGYTISGVNPTTGQVIETPNTNIGPNYSGSGGTDTSGGNQGNYGTNNYNTGTGGNNYNYGPQYSTGGYSTGTGGYSTGT